MKQHVIISTIFCLAMLSFNAQKRSIQAEDYKTWRSISSPLMSQDASLVGYQAKPLEGDATLYLFQRAKSKLDSFQRGEGLRFNLNSDLAVFKITPGFDTLRTLKLKKVKKNKWPKDSLCIVNLRDDTLVKVSGLKKYALSKEGNTLCYLTNSTVKAKGWRPFSKTKPLIKVNMLNVYTAYPNIFLALEGVTDFRLSDDGNRLAVLKELTIDKEKSYSISVYDLRSKNPVREFDQAKKFKLSRWSASADKFAFYQSQDTSLENYELYIYDFKTNKSTIIGNQYLEAMNYGDSLPSIHQKPLFSKDEQKMVFGIAKRLYEAPEDSLLASEKASVDIWHYLDQKIQPQQLKGLKREKKKSDWFLYSFKDQTLRKLNNDTLSLSFDDEYESNYHLASSNEAYAISNQWSYPWARDMYRIDLDTQEELLIVKGVRFGGRLSPNGAYYTFYNPELSEHMAIRINERDTICLTCSVDSVIWSRDKNGLPAVAGPKEVYGFSRDMAYYFQSERDLWMYDFNTDSLSCLSKFEGASRNIVLALRKKQSDSMFVDIENSYVQGFNKTTKGMHVFGFKPHKGHYDLIENLASPQRLVGLSWSEDGESVLLRRSTVDQYPDLYVGNAKLNGLNRISDINPQQANLKWARVDLVSWMSYDSVQLEGLVYLPESYDTAKSYPMLVYYYELNSDNLYSYRSPRPSASIINPVECASNDYIVFVPDIRYREGYPAQSAYDAVMSGTDFMIKNYAVDSLKMGLQGQSWGGYQTAQLITMTGRYAAAMAGAPVSNMFSAYGGIRWGSGLNRQFQYEATQSRIGKTIWEAPELYYENSPIFHLPKVTTPLLIMHNDEDGAVPWYQGIEMYNGMRRLDKRCWMLVYNKDGHNLKKLPNKYDLSKRMGQFFDHYLKSAPMPIWMSQGIRAIDKGEKNGYGYDEE